jgi:vancomycin permeability regulator SanA
MIKSIMRITLLILLGALVIGVLVLVLPRLVTAIHASSRIKDISAIAEKPVAIVFGAGLWYDGSPTPVLRDRVRAAADLYFSGKVEKLLMSGTTFGTYNEPRAMRNFAQELGIPNEAIVQDYGGWRTYDTCYRALHIFGVKEAILVTQNFHLARALYLCNKLGVESEGFSADLRDYRRRSQIWWNLREIPATFMALWEVYIQPPEMVLGDPDPIFPSEAQ